MADSILAAIFSAIESGKRRVKDRFTEEGLSNTALNLDKKLQNLSSTDSAVSTKEALELFGGGVTGTIGSAARVLGPEAAFQAQRMLSKGAANKDVFAATKAYEGPLDKQLRAVISDANMQFKQEGLSNFAGTGKAKLGEVLDHPELYKAYPGLRQVELNIRNLGQDSAAYKFDPATQRETIFLDPTSITQSNIYGHEIQHAIQEFEDFTRGGSPKAMIKHPDYGKFVSEQGEALSKQKIATKDTRNMNELISDAMYKHLGGEAEARITERQILENDFTSFPLDLIDVNLQSLIKDMRLK